MGRGKSRRRAGEKFKNLYAGIAILTAMVVVIIFSYSRVASGEQNVGDYYRGADDGAVLIEEFSDFT